jgi:SAM-dependent methyltransferase
MLSPSESRRRATFSELRELRRESSESAEVCETRRPSVSRPFVQLASDLVRGPLRLQRRVSAMLRRARLGRREEPFASTYAYGHWSRIQSEPYFSGTGSLPENVGPYVRLVSEYIRANAIRSVVDLGCGDFRASRALDLNGANYLGVDIVSRLIDYNTRHFSSDQVRFARLDFGRDRLPAADLCVIKQVLQHWSNADILTLLPRLDVYSHVLILDGWIAATATPGRNLDIPTGGGSRHGGLYLEAPPFDWPIDVLHSYRSANGVEEYRLVRHCSAQLRGESVCGS